MMRSFRDPQGGFTLTEMMVAVAILGLISIMSFGTLRGAADARDLADSVSDRYHSLRQSLLRMSRELQSAYLSEHRDCEDPKVKTIFISNRSSHGMRLDFASFSHFKIKADANESDQNELAYFVDTHPEDSDRLALMRREQARIDEEPEEGGLIQMMAEDVTELTFEFYDREEKEWEEEWDSTSSDKRMQLPMFVSISIKAKDHMGEDIALTTKTRLFMKKSFLITGNRCADID